jgi:hypothetical protein
MEPGDTLPVTAKGLDQFGNPMALAASELDWSLSSGGQNLGSITSTTANTDGTVTAVFTCSPSAAPAAAGVVVSVSAGSVQASSALSVPGFGGYVYHVDPVTDRLNHVATVPGTTVSGTISVPELGWITGVATTDVRQPYNAGRLHHNATDGEGWVSIT